MRARRRQLILVAQLVGAVLLGAGPLGGCRLEADYAGSAFTCPDPGRHCPAGFRCEAGVCVNADAGGPGAPDGPMSPIDAPPGHADASHAPDAPLSVCQQAHLEPKNDGCSAAIDLTAGAKSAGGITIAGDTTMYTNDLSPPVIVGCTGAPQPGKDAVYRVDAIAGDHLELMLGPEAWDAGLYVLAGCSLSATCLGGSDNLGAGSLESATITFTTAGTFYVVVDADTTTAAGCYTLHAKLTHP